MKPTYAKHIRSLVQDYINEHFTSKQRQHIQTTTYEDAAIQHMDEFFRTISGYIQLQLNLLASEDDEDNLDWQETDEWYE